MPELLALLPLVELPDGAVPVRPALLARHLQVAGAVLRVLVVARQVAGRGRRAPRGVAAAPRKGLVVFWEGQVLAGTLAREGLLRGQAGGKGEDRSGDPQGVCGATPQSRALRESCRNPKEQLTQTAGTSVTSSRSRALLNHLLQANLQGQPPHQADLAAPLPVQHN